MPSERRRDGETPANEFGMVRSYLARQGVSQADIAAVIGIGAQGRSRGEITDVLRVWMRALPKEVGIIETFRMLSRDHVAPVDTQVMAEADGAMVPGSYRKATVEATKVAGHKVARTVRKTIARAAYGFEGTAIRASAAVDRATDRVVGWAERRQAIRKD